MPIFPVLNSPIGWRDQIEDVWTQCENNYSQAWLDGDTLRFQVKALKIGQDILEGNALLPYLTGTTTSDGSSTLVDTGATFTSTALGGGEIVTNVSAGTQSEVTTVAATVLGLNSDIFGTGTSGDSYEIMLLAFPTGNVEYDYSLNVITFAPVPSISNTIVLRDAFPTTSARYVVELDIEDYAGGELRVQSGSTPTSFSNFDVDAVIANGNGTISFYGLPVGNDMRLLDSSTESSYTITGIRIYETSQVKWFITDDEFTTEFDNGTPTAGDYIHDRCLVEITPSLADGSYAIQIEDRLLTINGGYIRNYQFPSNEDFGWTLTNTGTGWAIASNRLEHTAGGGVGTNYAEVELRKTTNAECNYRITATQTGDNPGVEGKQADGTYVSIGTLSGTLTFTGYAFTHIRFNMTEVDTGTLDTIVLEPVLTCPDLESYPICVSAALDSSLLEFTSTISADAAESFKRDRWVGASTDYTETMYLGSNIRFARYEDPDGETYRDNVNANQIVFSNRIKVHECQLAPVPTWVHDWVTWAVRNAWTVDDISLYPYDLGSYSPNWEKRTGNAPVVFDVALTEQDIKGTLCD